MSEYTTDPTLRLLQLTELEILKVVVKVCEEYNIRYFLTAGTLLGAARHGGFIPWDDDVDIGMPRPDYERFCEIAPKALPNNLFFQTHITDKNYFNTFAKARMNNTAFVQETIKHIDMHHGVYIDIFPYDGMPDKYEDAVKFREKIMKLHTELLRKTMFRFGDRPLLKSILVYIYNIFINENKLFNKIEKLLKTYSFNETQVFSTLIAYSSIKDIMPKSIMFPLEKMKFEDAFFLVPHEYRKFLDHRFGDYMQPPPIEKRESTHSIWLIDLEKGYKAQK